MNTVSCIVLWVHVPCVRACTERKGERGKGKGKTEKGKRKREKGKGWKREEKGRKGEKGEKEKRKRKKERLLCVSALVCLPKCSLFMCGKLRSVIECWEAQSLPFQGRASSTPHTCCRVSVLHKAACWQVPSSCSIPAALRRSHQLTRCHA